MILVFLRQHYQFLFLNIGYEFIICYGCGITCHLYCYGIKTKHNKVKNSLGEEALMFICEKCRTNSSECQVVSIYYYLK